LTEHFDIYNTIAKGAPRLGFALGPALVRVFPADIRFWQGTSGSVTQVNNSTRVNDSTRVTIFGD